MPTSRRGFTLVELLVVISIVAILATVGVVVFSNLQKNGRDAKRQSDLRIIQSALEQYHADQGYYPDTVTSGSSIASGSKTYLQKVPADPLSTSQYHYKTDPDPCTGSACIKYCLYAAVENSSNAVDLTECSAVIGYNYEVAAP